VAEFLAIVEKTGASLEQAIAFLQTVQMTGAQPRRRTRLYFPDEISPLAFNGIRSYLAEFVEAATTPQRVRVSVLRPLLESDLARIRQHPANKPRGHARRPSGISPTRTFTTTGVMGDDDRY
jgi:hypothetical protein